jgi:hypothetical protein
MSDYLTSIVARTLAPAALRPRTRLLFEPQAASDTPFLAAEEMPPARAENERTAPAPPALRRASGHSDHRDVVHAEARTDSGSLAANAPIAAPLRHEPSAVAEVTTERDDASKGGVPPPVFIRERIVETPPRTITEIVEAPPRQRVIREHEPPRERERIESVTREAAILIERDESREPERSSIDAAPRPRAPRETRRAVHESQPHVMGAPQRREERGLVEPVVNVSIGRIEVRAVPSAVPAPHPRATAPRLTLDDYLDRRNGKTR